MHRTTIRLAVACLALALAGAAAAQAQVSTTSSSPAKKELVQKVLQLQQTEIENVARGLVERPAAQMMQEAGLALQRQTPDKREAMGKAIEAEVKKYIDESYPLVRERALRLAPTTIGAVLEEKISEDELKQLVAWLDSPVNKKYQQLGPDMRNAFIQKLLTTRGRWSTRRCRPSTAASGSSSACRRRRACPPFPFPAPGGPAPGPAPTPPTRAAPPNKAASK